MFRDDGICNKAKFQGHNSLQLLTYVSTSREQTFRYTVIIGVPIAYTREAEPASSTYIQRYQLIAYRKFITGKTGR
jgi:hypothetical protein